jgi:radical SAM protein with 4Fe4S-binding SPASM domain
MKPPFLQESGFLPFLISWNITKRCNLRCAHCYLDAAELEGSDEITTEEGIRFIDDIASLNPQAMLILTGGEPLLRPDLTKLSSYASEKGLTVVLGTNGTLLNDRTVKELVLNGIRGVGISIDSVTPAYHDRFRGLDGGWEKTLQGIKALQGRGLDFQIQLTVTRENHTQIPDLIEFAHKLGAQAVNVFFLVCTGRGQDMTDITPEEYERILTYLVAAENEFSGRIMVRARCAPHILRIASKVHPESNLLKGETSGCIAATGYFRISPEGYVTPCPYMPADPTSPNLKQRPLNEIWEETEVFSTLRDRNLNGRCGECEFIDLCGGCRARALATSGDIMGEDLWCTYKPEGKRPSITEKTPPLWTEPALERLGKVPLFLRPMVKKGVERYAKTRGLSEITPEVMAELRKKTGT